MPQITLPQITLDIPQAELEKALEPRIPLPGVSWLQYESMVAAVGNRPQLRLTYLAGTLEIMTISPEHEMVKTMIAHLLYTYTDVKSIDLFSCGSATFKNAATARGLEPDESFCIGQRREFPDLAIEVVITTGGIDKLAVYQGLGVQEAWFWQTGQFSLYQLRPDATGYDPIPHSGLLPDLDLELLAQHVTPEIEPQAFRAFCQAICP
jgi:Uma2 family endonuclease